MSQKYSARRTDEEWLQIITECRRSGLSDAGWCHQHDIPKSTFYNAVARLHDKACEFPERSGEVTAMDLTAPKEPVEIHVIDHSDTHMPVSATPAGTVTNPDNPHVIEITIGPATIKVSGGADPALLQSAILAIGRLDYAG